MRKVVLIAHNLRSSHNVGSLLRTADGLGITKVYLTGYTPYPLSKDDQRLPHIAQKVDRQIAKTALGAEKSVAWEYSNDIYDVISSVRKNGFTIAALEQSPKSTTITKYSPPEKLALIVGREVEGIESEILGASDVVLEIPMRGHKESFNVVQAAAMALYQISFLAD